MFQFFIHIVILEIVIKIPAHPKPVQDGLNDCWVGHRLGEPANVWGLTDHLTTCRSNYNLHIHDLGARHNLWNRNNIMGFEVIDQRLNAVKRGGKGRLAGSRNVVAMLNVHCLWPWPP